MLTNLIFSFASMITMYSYTNTLRENMKMLKETTLSPPLLEYYGLETKLESIYVVRYVAD